MCTPGSLCCNTLSSHSNPGMCHCALLKLNFSFYTQFSMADPLLGPNHGTALGRTRHPQVAVVLTRVMQGTRQPTRVLWLHPPFPSRKVNCAKQKNRLEIEPGNKEGLISFVSVLAFFFSCSLHSFSLSLSAEGACLHPSAEGLFWSKRFRSPSRFTGKRSL